MKHVHGYGRSGRNSSSVVSKVDWDPFERKEADGFIPEET